MKKRYLLLILVMLLALAFSACGGGEKETSNDVSQAESESAVEELGERLAASYIEILESEQYFMKYKSVLESEDGSSMEMTVSMAMDGDNVASNSEGSGFSAKTVMKDNKVYTIDDASKTVIVMDNPEMPEADATAEEAVETEGLKYIGTGEEDGLVYEEYSVISGNVKYYFDGDELVKIVTSSEGDSFTIEILELKKGFPKEMFDIPSDYQLMEF